MTVQLSVGLTSFSGSDRGDWGSLLETVALLDETGVDRVVVSDHVVFGEQLDDYGRPELGGTAGGRQPTGSDGHWLEPLTTLAVVAGRTQRIRLGTAILLAALRRPVVLAKTAATLDVLSHGRLDLGVGVGWQAAEYAAAGLDFAERGRLLDDCLEVCRRFWRDDVVHLDESAESPSGPLHMMPKPLQAGGVPVWVSGTHHQAVVRRLARFGSGWIPWGPDAADPAASIPRMRASVTAAGGDGDALGVVANLALTYSADETIDLAATLTAADRLVAAGATDLRVRFRPTDLDTATVGRFVTALRERTSR